MVDWRMDDEQAERNFLEEAENFLKTRREKNPKTEKIAIGEPQEPATCHELAPPARGHSWGWRIN